MRILLCFLICVVGCQAQRPEAEVLAVYSQLEKAVQTGDANTFVGLWSRKSASEAEKIGSQLHAQPDVHYTSSRVFVQGDEAVLLGQYSQDGFLSVRFVKEDGRWKIKDFAFSDTPYPAESVYAMIPPSTGAFERAGEPWQKVAPAFDEANAAAHGFQVRAAYDESFLYVRIESSMPFPAPGSPAETPPIGWPVMKVDVSGAGEFVLDATANIGDQATFDKDGRANSHLHFVSYWLSLERANKPVFRVSAGPDPNPLIQAGDHFFEVRVPLRTMGVADVRPTKITIGDATWPKSVTFNLEAQQYR
ncbi:MAG TPA: nuclear transport factor 2 family protein [Candidatus Acidoferrum sp.]|nr:nuclear transport factor 2 family protein [Candidatus Acidoferrum sp.]